MLTCREARPRLDFAHCILWLRSGRRDIFPTVAFSTLDWRSKFFVRGSSHTIPRVARWAPRVGKREQMLTDFGH